MAIKDGAAYEQLFEELATEYGPKALELLRKIRDICRAAGLATEDEPWNVSADEYSYSLLVWRGEWPEDGRGSIAIDIDIAEQRIYEGADDDVWGVNFGLDIVEEGGRIIGGLTPFNYTEFCWVDARQPEAVEQRFSIFESADLREIPALIGLIPA